MHLATKFSSSVCDECANGWPKNGVSAFIILYDSALRQIAREYPATETEFGQIRNVGSKKAKDFGPLFLAEIAEHLKSNPRQIFAND